MESDETLSLASSGAVAGLCPLTEADLGDGTFDAVRFLAAGGRFGVGSDSNVAIDGAAELRQLEYSQRLAIRARNVLGGLGLSTGRALFEAALHGGDNALRGTSGLEPGRAADIVALDDAHPSYPSLTRDHLMDVWVFSAGKALVQSVWVGGRKLVENGSHQIRDAVAQRYHVAMKGLIH